MKLFLLYHLLNWPWDCICNVLRYASLCKLEWPNWFCLCFSLYFQTTLRRPWRGDFQMKLWPANLLSATQIYLKGIFPPLNWRFSLNCEMVFKGYAHTGLGYSHTTMNFNIFLTLLRLFILIMTNLWFFTSVSVIFFLTFIINIRLLMTVTLSLLLMNFSLRHLYYMKKKLR